MVVITDECIGYQYNTYVYGIDRQNGFIILRADHLILESGLFNVIFVVQGRDFGPHTRAVIDCGKSLTKSGSDQTDKFLPRDNDRSIPDGNTSLTTTTSSPPKKVHSPVASNPEGNSYLRKMLFPEKEDGVLQTTLGKGFFQLTWFDAELNWEQQVRLLMSLGLLSQM